MKVLKEPTLEQLKSAFRSHGLEPPPEYVWLVEHRTIGFDAFTQLEPWHFCSLEEIIPLTKRWPSAGITRELIPFAREQGSDDLACFEFVHGRTKCVHHLHYNLGPPVYVEFQKEYSTVWDWLKAVLDDVRFWFERGQR